MFRVAVLVVLLALGGLVHGLGTDQVAESISNRANTMLLMLNVIDQISIIIPGQGLNSIKIGDSFEQLIALWGTPHRRVTKKGVEYQLDSKTTIQFRGKRKIKRIQVQGLIGSIARVNNGVTFGMSADQVRDKFNVPADKDTSEVLRYKRLGVEFIFVKGGLIQIDVFAP